MGRYLVFLLAFQLLWPWAAYAPAFAQEAPVAQASAPNLDLSSTDRSVAASTVLPDGQATINLAGVARTISPTDMLTAAEMVAVRQVVNTGNQYLQLNDLGAAIGGGLHLQYYATNGLGNLVIPEGVRASQNAAILQSLNLTGNLSNSGTLNFFSSNAAVTAATVNATNIYNNAGAMISSTLANLNLNAVNNIVNAGTIMSAGNLSMTAGGSIVNSGIIQAMQNMNMQASTIANQAQIAATLGNINMATANLINSGLVQAMAGKLTVSGIANELNINNLNGILSASKELSILNTSVLKPTVNVLGGQLLGDKVNFDANDGHLNVSVQDLAGDVNVKGGTAKFAVSDGTHPFYMESWALTGDPDLILNVASYNDGGVGFNADGGVVEITTSTGGITFTGNIVTTPTGTGNGGHVYLTSATFIDTANITTDGNGGNGGEINLLATTTIDTDNLSAAGTVAGDITLTSGGYTTTGGTVAGNNVTYDATGNVTLGNSVTASNTLSIYSGGTTGIAQTTGTLTGQNIVLTVGGGGTIGSDVDAVETATENLSVSSNILYVTPFSISAGVYVNNDSGGQPLNLSGNGAGFQGLFSLTTNGDLNVLAGSTIMGNSGGSGTAIEITASGQITVATGAAISAYQGYTNNDFNSLDQAVVINTNDLENNGTISGSSVTVNAGGSGLTVSECGGCNGLINVTTSVNGSNNGFINFVSGGSVTVHQNTLSGLVSTGGSTATDFTVSVDNGALYFGSVEATGAIDITHNNTYGDIIFGPTNPFGVGDGSMTADNITITTSSNGSVRLWNEYALNGTTGTEITAGFVSNNGTITDLDHVTIQNPNGTLSLGGGGVIDAPNINLDANGNLIALQAEFIGTLNASIPHGATSSDYLLLIFSAAGAATLGTIDIPPQIVTNGGTVNGPLSTSTDSHGGVTYSFANSSHTFGNILLLNTALPDNVFNPMNDTLYVSVGGQVDTGACSTCPIAGNLYFGDVKISGLVTGASMLVFTSENNEILGNLNVQNGGLLYGANGGQWGEISTKANATWWATSFTATGGGHIGPVTIDDPIISLDTATWSIFTSNNFVLNTFSIGYPHININKASGSGRFLLMAGSGLSAWNELNLSNTMTISSAGQTDIYGYIKAGSLDIQVTNGNFTMDNGFIQNSSCGFCFGLVYYQLTTNGPNFNLSVSNGNLTMKNGLHYQPYIDFNSCGICLAPDSPHTTISVTGGNLSFSNGVSMSVAGNSSLNVFQGSLSLTGTSLNGFSSISANNINLQDSFTETNSIISNDSVTINHTYIFAESNSNLSIKNYGGDLPITNGSVLKSGSGVGKNINILNYDGNLLITNQSILDATQGNVYISNTNGNVALNNGATITAVGPNYDDGVISILNSGGSITIVSEIINTAVTDSWGSYCYGCSPFYTMFGAQGPTINSSGTAQLVTSGGNLSITGPGTNDIWSPAGLTLISTTGSVNVNQVVLDPYYFDTFYEAWYLTGMSGSTFTVQVATSNIVANTIVANNYGISANGTISLIVGGNGNLNVQAGSVLSANKGNVYLQNLNTAGTIVIGQDSFLTAISDGASLGNVYLLSGPDPGSYVTGTAPANLVAQEVNGGQIFYGSQSLTASAPDNHVTADGGTVAFNGSAVTSIQLGGNVTINAKAEDSTPQLLTSLDLVNDPNAIAQILALQALGSVGGTLQTSGPNIIGGNAIIAPSVLAPWLTAENIPDNVTIEFTDFDDTTPTSVYLTSTSTTDKVTISGTHSYTNGNPSINIISNLDTTVLSVAATGLLESSTDLLVQGNGNIQVLGQVSAENLTIVTTGGNGNITVDGTVNGNASLTLVTSGSGSIRHGESPGTVTAPVIALITDAGNIGTSNSSRFYTNATVGLMVSTNSGSAYLSQNGSVQLSNSSLGQSLFESTTVLDLITTSNGDIVIDGATVRAGTIILTAGGSGNIDQTTNNTTFEANSMTLRATSGWIGGPNSTTGLSLALQTQELSASTTGDIYINSTGFDPVTLRNISSGAVLDLEASGSTFTIANGSTVQATWQSGPPALINLTMNFNLLTVESGARLQVNSAGTISISGTSQVTNEGVIATPLGASGGTFYSYTDGFAGATLIGAGNIIGDLHITSTDTSGFDTSVSQNSISGAISINSDSQNIFIQTITGDLTLGAISGSAAIAFTVNNNGNVILNGSTIDLMADTSQINLHSLTGSVTGTLASTLGTLRGSALLNFNITNNDTVNGTRLETIITNYGSITITNTVGDVTVITNSTIYANQGNLTINNLNTTDGQIVIESDAELTASTTGTTLGKIYLVIGGIPSSPDTGPTPSNVTANELNGGVIYFGTGQVNASPSTNTVTADGTNASVVFSIGSAPGPAILLGGNTTITSQTEQTFTPLTSLDLSDASVVTAIENLQTAHYIGGSINTDNTAVILPYILDTSISALNVPNLYQVTLANFDGESVNIDITGASTTSQATVVGTLQFLSASGASVSTLNITSTEPGPAFLGGNSLTLTTGQMTSDGSLTVNVDGAINFYGVLHASTRLTLDTSDNTTDGSITLGYALTNQATAAGAGGAVILNAGTIIDINTINTSGTGIGKGGAITLTAEGDISIVGLVSNGGNIAGGAGNITISSASGAVTLDSITATAQSGNAAGLVSINAFTGFTGGNIESASVSITTEGGQIALIPGSTISINNGNLLLQNNDTVDGTIYLGTNSTFSLTSTLGDIFGNVYIVLGNVPTSPVTGSTPPNMNIYGSPYFGTNSITSNAPVNSISAPSSTVIFNTGSAAATAITVDGNVRIESDVEGTAGSLASLDLTDPFTVNYLVLLQEQAVIGGTLVVTNGIATGGNVILAPTNLPTSLTAYNIPDNVTVTMQGFTGSDFVTIDISGASTSSQAILAGTHEFTGAGAVGQIEVTSTQTGPAFLVNSTGLLTSAGNLSLSAPSVTNEGSITSQSNGTITLITDDFRNDTLTSLVDAGGFGSVIIHPLSSNYVVHVGGAVRGGSALDIIDPDMANIVARNLTIGDSNNTGSLYLADDINVSTLYNLTLLSADTVDMDSQSITLGFNTLSIEAGADAYINGIFGTGTTISITALGVLYINDAIEAVDPGSAFSINGNIHLSGSPIMFNLDPGENINAGTFNGIVTIHPSSAMDINFFTPTQGGVNFDISQNNLDHIRSATLNIGNFTSTDSITLADDVDLGFTSIYRQLNFYTNGSYEYNDFTFDSQSRAVGIYALGAINAGDMTTGSNALVMDALGTVTLNGTISASEVTLAGSPVILNGNVLNAFTSLILRPTTSMAVNVGGTTASGTSFDITAGDLANITTQVLTIGDGLNASSMTVVADLDVSGPIDDPGNYDLVLISNGNFTSQGQTITLGREEFDNSNSLTITTYGSAQVGAIETIANVGAGVYITAGGNLNLNDNIVVTGGTVDNSGRIELRGSPVTFNGNSLDAGPAGFVALAPTSDTIVAIADATGTAAPFDISASDLANITTGTLQIGDIYHTQVLNVEDDIDLSSSYNLVLVSAGAIDRTGISITLGSNNLGLSTNGGLSNLATGDLDISYLFDGNSAWRQAYTGNSNAFTIMTGGSSFTNLASGWIDMGVDGGSITIDAGRNFNYTASGASISFVAGTSSTGGYVGLSNVNLSTSGGDYDITVTGRGDPLLGMGGVQIGSISNSSIAGEVSILADSAVYVGSSSVSRVSNNFSVVADSHINVIGSVVAENIVLHAVDNNGGVSVQDNLYANDSIDISAINVVQLFTVNGSSYIEAPTITITTSADPLSTVIISEGVQVVTPVMNGSSGAITITTPALSNDGLIAALGAGATLTIQAPAGFDLAITAFNDGKLVADPLSGLITFQSADGEVNVTQKQISGIVTGSAATAFYLTSQSGLLTLSDITATNDEITITSGSDIQIIPGSTIVAEGSVAFVTNAANASLIISADSIESASATVDISNFSYVKNDGTITAATGITIENTLSTSADLILTGLGSLVAPSISLESNNGAVIATQNNMQGTVNISSESTLVLSVLNPSSFTPGTMTSTTYGSASLVSSFSNLYAAANSPITFGDAVFATTTGTFGTFTVNSGVLTVTGTGNMVILIRDTDAGITSIDGIATGGGSLYFDTTAAGGLNFTGNLDTRGGADTSGGYVVLGSTNTITTEAILTGGVGGGGTDEERSGGSVIISSAGNISINEYIDARGEELGSGGNVILLSAAGDITFSVTNPLNGNINAVGGSAVFAEGKGGNILIGAGDAVTFNSFIDSSAESSFTSNSRGSAGWIHIAAGSISSTSSIRANGGADFSTASGNGGSINLVAGSISVGGFIDSAGLGSGFGGDITLHAGSNISFLSANATGGRTSVEPINGGNIVIQSDSGTITSIGFLDSSASAFDWLDGGGRAGMIFLVAQGDINGTVSARAEGRSRPGNESSDLPGNGGNIRIETNGEANFGFVSSSAQSVVATRAAANGSAGRIDVLANDNVNASTFKSTGSLSGGNGGDVNITSSTGNVTTSFIFTNAPGYDVFSSDSYGNGGDVSITSAGSVSIGSFIDIGGSANFGNAGSINIQAESNITSTSYLAANGGALGGNGGNIVLTAQHGGIDFDFSLDTAAREGGNGGYIILNAEDGIQATVVATRGGNAFGHGGDIVMTQQGTGSIQLERVDSSTSHNTLVGSSNAGYVSLSSSGNLAVLGDIDAYAEGVSGNGGIVTLSYNSAAGNFVIDSDDNSITNGVKGAIDAYASGSGNGGSVAIANQGGDLNVTLNSRIDVTSFSGVNGSINFNFAPPGSDLNVNATSDVNITGGASGLVAGFIFASGLSITMSMSGTIPALELSELTATNGSISITLANGSLETAVGANLQATQGNITLKHTNTSSGIIFLETGSTLTASATSGSLGNVYISIGDYTAVTGTTPSDVTVDEQNGGQVYFGTNSITSNAPQNFANADGADIVFDTGSRPANAITLNGDVTINATEGGGLTLLNSLDLTDPTVTALIINLQGTMELGGTLIVDGGGIATGGNVIIGPANLAAALTAYNIPQSVTVSMQGFTLSDVVSINIDGSSHTSQAVLNGTYEYIGGSPSAGVVNVSSNQAGPVFLMDSSGLLTSNGSLSLTANGAIQLNGATSAVGAVAITSTNGSLTVNTINTESNTSGNAGAITLTATGAITTINTINSAKISGASGNGGNIILNSGTSTFTLGNTYAYSNSGAPGTLTFYGSGNAASPGSAISIPTVAFQQGATLYFYGFTDSNNQSLSFQSNQDIEVSEINTSNFGTGNAGNISLASTGAITVTSRLATVADSGTGGNVTINSGTSTFNLSSLWTYSSSNTPGTIAFYGSGNPSAPGSAIATPTVTFAFGSDIWVYGSKSSAISSLSFNLANSNTIFSIDTHNSGTGAGGDISLTAANAINVGVNLTTYSNGGAGGNISLNSGTSTFNLTTLNTHGAGGLPGTITFYGSGNYLSPGTAIAVPTVTFLSPSSINAYGNSSSNIPSLSFFLGNSTSLVAIDLFNLGTGSGGSMTLTSAGAISVSQRIDVSSSGGAAGNITLNSGTSTFNLKSLLFQSDASTPGALTFYSSGNPSSPGSPIATPTIAFGTTAIIYGYGNSSGTLPSLSFNLANGNSISAIITSNHGTGNAGDITLTSSNNILVSGLFAEAESGHGGNVSVTSSGDIAGNYVTTSHTGTSGNVTLTSATLNYNSIFAGNGLVTLNPNQVEAVAVGGTSNASPFFVSNDMLTATIAGTVSVSSQSTLAIADNLDVSGSGQGNYNLVFTSTGNFTSAGQTITLGDKSLDVSTLGSINSGVVTGTSNSSVDLSAQTGLVVSGTLNAGNIQLSTNNGHGDVTLSASITAADDISISSSVQIIQTTGTISGTGLTLNAASGIGVSNPIQTAVSSITINNGDSSGAYIHEANGVLIFAVDVAGDFELTSSSGQVRINGATTVIGGSATIIANGDIRVSQDITVDEGNLILQDMNTSSGAIIIDSGTTLSASTTGDTLGRVYIFIGTTLPTGTNTTTPSNVVVNNTNGGVTYFGTNSITASAPDNHVNSNGSAVIFDTGSLSASAISLGGNVTINGTATPDVEGPIYSLDFTDPNLTALIIQLQGESQIGGTLIVNGQGVATGGNAIIGANMLSNTLTGTNIPT
ncbi:MAG: hypothetical protein K2Y22_12490, partial [Candidatus Obscuribacterales bacterium]|nr:hypothetical protein [Candidatus Obscuribacterales bacterium]